MVNKLSKHTCRGSSTVEGANIVPTVITTRQIHTVRGGTSTSKSTYLLREKLKQRPKLTLNLFLRGPCMRSRQTLLLITGRSYPYGSYRSVL